MQSTGDELLCAVLLQVDTRDRAAASKTRKGQILQVQSGIGTRFCLELGNLADEQPLQCPMSRPTLVLLGPLVPAKPHSSQSCINPFF